MHRRFSSLVRSPASPSTPYEEDSESKISTIVKEEATVTGPPSLKVKRVDYFYSRWSKGWKYRNTSSKVTVESLPLLHKGADDPWKDYIFVVVRTIPRQENLEPTFKVVIKSEYLLKALKDVIKTWPGISWNSDPLELDPEIFLTFLEEFTTYRDELMAKKDQTEVEKHVASSVDILLSFLHSDYKHTIATISTMKKHAEISFSLLYAILVPGSILVTRCAITELPRLFKLKSFTRTAVDGLPCYQLFCESIDLVDKPITQTVEVGKVSTTILLRYFKGTEPMEDLDAYPLRYHADPEKLKEIVIQRGKKWAGLIGIHHKQFNGIAALRCGGAGEPAKLLRHSVNGRIMVDRATFRKHNANYRVPIPVMESDSSMIKNQTDDGWGNPLPVQTPPSVIIPSGDVANGNLVTKKIQQETSKAADLSDEDLLLTSTVVYGFSLTDKLWLEFDVTKIEDIVWNEEAFANLVLPTTHKELLQSLVEAHHHEHGFDDFIKGKGHGLVVNLFGPPGVGKTFSAEATSEHVRRPLYLVGAGDLGTNAEALDRALEKVFEVATAWKAIVLIDEADVFLEQRSLHDLYRNAMVAVFLRHVEYYRGILFLTTNRVKAFDEAFLSRIHVALHFSELSISSKVQVWSAFISKLGMSHDITPEQMLQLAERQVNGRQIKNAARTAQSLALGKGEKLSFKHFIHTLDAMDDFTREFDSTVHRGGLYT